MSFININNIPDLLVLSFIITYIIEQIKKVIKKDKYYNFSIFILNFLLSFFCLYFCKQTLFNTSNTIFNYILTTFFITSNASGIYDLLDFLKKIEGKKDIIKEENTKPNEKNIMEKKNIIWEDSPYEQNLVRNIKRIHDNNE